MIDKDKYLSYYSGSGSYRKWLLRQESVDAARMFDYFSRLELRCRDVERCREIRESRDSMAADLVVKVGEFIKEMATGHDELFRFPKDQVGRAFAETYDMAASVVEGFERAAHDILARATGRLSEEASAIRRRTHFQRTTPGNNRRSMVAKAAWKRDRHKYINAIRTYHKSTAGKAFHRNLGRFNARRMENFDFTRDDILMTCKGISSCCTHLVVEIEQLGTQAAGRMTESDMGEAKNLREIFHIFQELLGGLVDSWFEEDKETVADVMDVVADYYDVVGAGDTQIPDTAGVSAEVMP